MMNLADRLKEISRIAEKGDHLEAKGLVKNWKEEAHGAASKGYRQVIISQLPIHPSPKDFGNYELAMHLLKEEGLFCKLEEMRDRSGRVEIKIAW